MNILIDIPLEKPGWIVEFISPLPRVDMEGNVIGFYAHVGDEWACYIDTEKILYAATAAISPTRVRI